MAKVQTMVEKSVMSGKLKHIEAINTSPLNNPFCLKMQKTDSICSKCYSVNMLKTFRYNCNTKFMRNGELLSKEELKDDQIPVFIGVIARLSAHGELFNKTHLRNYYKIAKKNRYTKFALWTKRKDLVQGEKKPSNVILVYSNPKIDEVMPEPPEGFDKVFNVVTDDKKHKVNCSKECFKCRKCYNMITKVNCIVEKIKLYKGENNVRK